MEGIPAGFRFYPTEEELVSFYLRQKLEGKRREMNRVIPLVNIYDLEPWHLPNISGELCREDTEQWFFFSTRQERETHGGRPTRTTASGYWKATGSPSYVYSSDNKVIGVKKSMVFYKGRTPTGTKTKWKMNEYKAIEEEMDNPSRHAVPKLRHELSLCRLYVTSGSSRAFDRRPMETKLMEATTDQEEVNGEWFAKSSDNIKMTEKTNSLEENIDGIESVGSTNLEMATGLEPLWEWAYHTINSF